MMIWTMLRIAIDALSAIVNKMDDEDFVIQPVERIRLGHALDLLKRIQLRN